MSMNAYEVLALVLGSLIARELMAVGIRSIMKNGNGKPAMHRIDGLEKELEDLTSEVKTMKRILLQVALKLGVEAKDLEELV